jgi:hypothetical protein
MGVGCGSTVAAERRVPGPAVRANVERTAGGECYLGYCMLPLQVQDTRAPAPLMDWSKMKKRELELLDVSFPKSVAPMRSPKITRRTTSQNPPIRSHQNTRRGKTQR